MIIPLRILCAALTIIAFVIPVVTIIINKIRLSKALKPVEYYPPRGYSPIDVLFKYYGERANVHNIINPLMLYWANRGYVTIEEDCKRGLKLTKLKDLKAPHVAKNVKLPKSVLKNFKYEKELFDSFFKDGDIFYTLAAPAKQNEINDGFMKNCKDIAKAERTKATKVLQLISMIMPYIALTVTVLCTYAPRGDAVGLAMIFPLVGLIFMRFVKVPGMFQYFIYFFFGVWSGVPFGVAIAFAPIDGLLLLLSAMLVCIICFLIVSDRIEIRSRENIEIFGLIEAFKVFLSDAETDRLETLVEENPSYYYDILPYCYILKLTEKLKEKFDRITVEGPSWYLGEMRDTLIF